MNNYLKIIVFICIAVLAAGCGKKETLISGKTMGTAYHITVVSGFFQNIAELQGKIEKRLKEVN
ncbi:MAG: hypothetical protein BWK80_54790, partial [Desulfobacteraceae bacterium IS3]